MSTAASSELSEQHMVDTQITLFIEETSPKAALVVKECTSILRVTNEDEYRWVCSKAIEAAGNIKSIEAYFQAHVDEAFRRHRRLTQKRTELLQPFELAKRKYGVLAAQFQQEQEVERQRKEEAARAEALRQQQADAAVQAEQLAAEGRVEEGVAVLEQPVIPVVSPTVASATPKVKGISGVREKYKAVVFDFKALVKAVAAGQVPIETLKPDQSALDKFAGVLKQSMNYPGVRLEKETGVSIRA